jgi:hypothetical protein
MAFGKVGLVAMESSNPQPYRFPFHLRPWHGKGAQAAVFGGQLRQSIISNYLIFVKPSYTFTSKSEVMNLENPIQAQNNFHKQQGKDETQYRIWRISGNKRVVFLYLTSACKLRMGQIAF